MTVSTADVVSDGVGVGVHVVHSIAGSFDVVAVDQGLLGGRDVDSVPAVSHRVIADCDVGAVKELDPVAAVG